MSVKSLQMFHKVFFDVFISNTVIKILLVFPAE